MNIGSSSSSQKRKNCTRSSEMKTPATADSSSSSQAKYCFGFTSMFHDTRTATTERMPSRMTIGADRPSTPTPKSMANPAASASIQSNDCTNWYPGSFGSKPKNTTNEIRQAMPEVTRATIRAFFAFSAGSMIETSAPRSGTTRNASSITASPVPADHPRGGTTPRRRRPHRPSGPRCRPAVGPSRSGGTRHPRSGSPCRHR